MNSRKTCLFALLGIVSALALGNTACKKAPRPESAAASYTPSSTQFRNGASAAGSNGQQLELSPVIAKLDEGGFKDFRLETGPFRTDAHKRFLADPMEFQPLPDQDLPTGKTAVVGSRICVLYPNADLASAADLARLPKGLPIPFGTIIPVIGERVEDQMAPNYYGMFEFQDNWNYFYRTTYKGVSGIVFGADLYGLDDSNEENRISASLYLTKGVPDAFYPVLGYAALPKEVAVRLERDRLALQTVGPDEYSLSGYRTSLVPDDMLALYAKHLRVPGYESPSGWNRKTPVFVTTDLAAHAQHLMFDRTLQYLEEAFFLPRLKALNAGFISRLKERAPEASAYQESLDKAMLYFQVAQALLDLAPDRYKSSSYEEPFTYVEKDRAEVLSAYPEAVRQEIDLMDGAAGFAKSPVFSFADGTQAEEDYSQYKPRGHYTKNGALSAYFRAMMWFGRIHFLIAQAGEAPLPLGNGRSSDSTALTLAMEPIALLVTDIARSDTGLYKDWCALFDPITALIGLSDDLSFKEVLPLWKAEGVSPGEFGAWVGNRENLLGFMKKAHEKLRPPAIAGSPVLYGPSEGSEHKPPMGWRLFGQRFTWDSAVHMLVSPPRLRPRDMVTGLDIMKAFGSRTADALLAAEYSSYPGLEERLDAFESDFNGRNASFWTENYYTNVLFQVRSLAQFEPGAGFYFTESPAWGIKAMLSAHGAWSELRHDTLLYAKQTYAERAGDGDFAPTFRTEGIPDPVHYLEPNVPFWKASALSVQLLLRTLDAYGLLDEETAKSFGRLQEIYAKAAGIAETEARNQPVDAKDVKWIATIPPELVDLVLVHVEGGDITDPEQLKMAIIADVYTNAEIGLVLETAVGIPARIYVALNDSQGGKRIAVGYVFNYYEFAQPIGDRLTDEAWKARVYAPGARLDGYRPFWAKDAFLAPVAGKGD